MRKYLTLFPLYITMTLAAPLLFSACQSGNSQPVIALVGGSLIDGNGGEPLPQAVVLVQDGKILATGSQSTIKIPAGAQVIDLNGTTILPGFFNAHVHTAYDPEKLRTWAQAGVTTVRDLGMHADVFGNSQAFQDNLALRNETLMDPQYARIVSAGPLMSPPDGYSGNGTVTDAQDAAQKTNFQLDAGLDLIKIGIEDNLPPGRDRKSVV